MVTIFGEWVIRFVTNQSSQKGGMRIPEKWSVCSYPNDVFWMNVWIHSKCSVLFYLFANCKAIVIKRWGSEGSLNAISVHFCLVPIGQACRKCQGIIIVNCMTLVRINHYLINRSHSRGKVFVIVESGRAFMLSWETH